MSFGVLKLNVEIMLILF